MWRLAVSVMNTLKSPTLVMVALDFAPNRRGAVVRKCSLASLMRSLFGGDAIVLSNNETPVFKVGRTGLANVFTPISIIDASETGRLQGFREVLGRLEEFVTIGHQQWLIVAHVASVALRNIDHLIPSDLTDPFSLPKVDFYWAKAGQDDVSNHSATPGLWAVRGEHLPLVLERLKKEWSKGSGLDRVDEEAIWTRVVQELPLRKRAFEKGEVVAPRIGAVDWEAVSNAAFVTVPDWPEKEAWKFLQALYFGTYLGDETGMMLNILEA